MRCTRLTPGAAVPDAPRAPRQPASDRPWFDADPAFVYGAPEGPQPPPPGHRGAYSDPWRQRVICRTCGVICLPDREDGAYVDVATSRGDLDAPYLPHRYPFEQDPRAVEGVTTAMGEPEEDAPQPEDWEPETYVLCRDAEGCRQWQGHPGEHDRRPEPRPQTYRGDAATFRSDRGIADKPRRLMPSRIDRSAEYARRNRKRRNARAEARRPS
jgi:hypothetical protein